MSKRAWAYIWGVLGIGAIITTVALTTVDQSADDLMTFLALTVLATAAQLFEAEAPNRQSYYPTRVFQFAGVVHSTVQHHDPHYRGSGRARSLHLALRIGVTDDLTDVGDCSARRGAHL